MIAIESAFQATVSACRSAFLEACASSGAQIYTVDYPNGPVDIGLVFLPAPSPQESVFSTASDSRTSDNITKGLALFAHTLEEAAILIFALHDEGWAEKYARSKVGCIAYVLCLHTPALDTVELEKRAPLVEFQNINLTEAIKDHTSQGELISLARRALFAAADAA